MEKENLFGQMELSTMVIGKMMSNMAMVKKILLIHQNTREIIKKDLNMDKVAIFGKMGPNILVNGFKIKSRDKVNINGMMADNTMEAGKIIKWKDLENIHGKMGGITSETMYKIKNMEKVFILGVTEENMMVIGIMEDNTDMAYTQTKMEYKKKEFG